MYLIKSLVLAMLCACAVAQASMPSSHEDMYPGFYHTPVRVPREVTIDKRVGNGKIFGTLGSDDSSLYGKAGYKGEIFNDARGRLSGEAYGARVLGANGDSSHFGGKLDWANRDAKASLDLNRQIGGRTSVSATGGGVWNFDKNTRLSAEGMYSRQLGGGRPDYGVFANFQHRF